MGKKMAEAIANKVAKLEEVTLKRSEIQEAAYNPRVIDDEAADKLADNLMKFGLVERLVWNKQTGTLVGGHQRLRQMDAMHGWSDGQDYEVPVSVVDLDEKAEKELNIVLNNPGVQGSWDVAKLEMLFREDVNPFNVGFEVADLSAMFPGEVVLDFIDRHEPEEYPEGTDGNLPGTPNEENVEDTAEEIAKIKEARSGHKEADGEALRSDHMIVLVFNKPSEVMSVLNALKLNPDEQFFMASRFFAAAATEGRIASAKAALDGLAVVVPDNIREEEEDDS